jgi:hypothetical protein
VIRNSLPGPHYFDVDMTLTKAFALPAMPVLGEGSQLQIRASFFNIFNTLNLQGNGTNSASGGTTANGISNLITSPNFGQVQSALGSRVITFEFRFQF